MSLNVARASSRSAFARYASARPEILRGERGGLEQVQLGEEADVLHWVVGQLGRDDLRQRVSHQLALERAVVQEHDRVEADVQRLADAADVVGLGPPVGDEDRDVLLAQHHVGMALEGLERGRVVVLAAHGEHDAAPLELAQILLQAVVRLAVAERVHLERRDAVVADDAAPQRVVEVDDHTLDDRAVRRGDQVDHVLGHQRQVLERAEGLGQRP